MANSAYTVSKALFDQLKETGKPVNVLNHLQKNEGLEKGTAILGKVTEKQVELKFTSNAGHVSIVKIWCKKTAPESSTNE